MPQPLQTSELQGLVTLILMLFVLTLFYYTILKSYAPLRTEVLRSRVVVKCINRDFEETRDYLSKGLFVGKLLEERCPRCSANLYVARIYSEPLFRQQKAKS